MEKEVKSLSEKEGEGEDDAALTTGEEGGRLSEEEERPVLLRAESRSVSPAA